MSLEVCNQPEENKQTGTVEIESTPKIDHTKSIFRTKRSYMPVELSKREKLIKAVEDEGMTIKVAAHSLKINYSTAKHIVKLYKRTGQVQSQVTGKRKASQDLFENETRQNSVRQSQHMGQSVLGPAMQFPEPYYKRLKVEGSHQVGQIQYHPQQMGQFQLPMHGIQADMLQGVFPGHPLNQGHFMPQFFQKPIQIFRGQPQQNNQMQNFIMQHPVHVSYPQNFLPPQNTGSFPQNNQRVVFMGLYNGV